MHGAYSQYFLLQEALLLPVPDECASALQSLADGAVDWNAMCTGKVGITELNRAALTNCNQ